jgi:ribonuclease BN (tRNA processing enzyme)
MEPLTLTILGASPAYPNPGGVCSGYLVRNGETNVVLDCGSGVVGRLRQELPLSQVDAVVISHLHADHYFDLVPFYYTLRYVDPTPAPIPLHVPPGGRAHLRRVGELVGADPAMFERLFAVTEYTAAAPRSIVDLAFSFHPVQHYVLSHAMRIRDAQGRVLVFSSDVAPCAGLVEAARDADLFLCESALIDRTQDEVDPTRRGHMLAGEAGEIARAAGARRLVLTHFRADYEGLREQHREAAERAFGQPVELAEEGKTYTV